LEFKKNEATARDAALKTWRQNMQNVQLLSAWLKSKDAPATGAVATENEVAETVVEEARMIHQYWSQFWARLSDGRASVDGRCEALFHGIPKNSPYPWTAPTGLQLMATAQKAKGVGGTDGWTAVELKFLPLAAFDKVSVFFQKAVSHEEFPYQFKQARMVCLPKPSKIDRFQVHPKDCRPITIMSTWWRLWVSTICHPQDMKDWLLRTLDPAVAGLGHGDIYNCLIKTFAQFNEQGYILGLDYEKAYDCLPYCTNRLLIVILKNRIRVCKDCVSVFNCQEHGQLLGTSSYQRVCVPKTVLVEERVWPRLASRRRV